MKKAIVQTAEMLSVLPDEDVTYISRLIKERVRQWDPDFTKVTPSERTRIDNAMEEIQTGDFYTSDDIWK